MLLACYAVALFRPVGKLFEWILRRWCEGLGLACVLACLASAAHAQSMVICINDEEFSPFTSPNHEGESQLLIRRAAERLDWQISFVSVPWRRCLAGVGKGHYDAVIGVSASPEYQSTLVFPHAARVVDQTRSLGISRWVVYRAVGSQASWDGQHFSQLSKPVLYPAGRATLKVALQRFAVPVDDTAKNSTLLARMLLKGRGSLVIDHSYQVEQLQALPEFKGRLEVLPEVFGYGPIHLAVSQQLYARHSQQVEALWDEIGALRRVAIRSTSARKKRSTAIYRPD